MFIVHTHKEVIQKRSLKQYIMYLFKQYLISCPIRFVQFATTSIINEVFDKRTI